MTIHTGEGKCCLDCGEPLGIPSYSEGELPPCVNPDCITRATPAALNEFYEFIAEQPLRPMTAVCEHGAVDPDDPNDPCMMCAL